MKVLVIITTEFIIGGGLTNSYLNYYSKLNDFKIDFASNNSIDIDLSTYIASKGSKYYNLGPRKKILTYRKNLCSLLKIEKYDCVHIHGNSSSLFLELSCCVKYRIKNKIIHIHNTKTNHPIINYIFRNYINSKSDYRLACSEEAGRWIFNKKFIVLKNCINFEDFRYDLESRNIIRKKYNIEDDTFIIGTVGRMNKQKNQIFLIENFETISEIFENCKIMIVGTGNQEEIIKAKIKSANLDDKFILTGFKSNTKDFYNAMDLFVFPSIFEGFGMVCVEAQLSGLGCCISNNVPKIVAMSDFCDFFDLNDIEAFRECLLFMKRKLSNINRNNICVSAEKGLIENKFDVLSNVEILKSIYRKEI